MHLLEQTQHRPYPLPSTPWVMTQTFNRLLFAHWPIPVSLLEKYIPSALTIDTFEGSAWISVIPFEISQMRLRWLPPIPFTSCFPEMNMRTYVIKDHKPGVLFFSLDATNPLAVAVARTFYQLPYFKADIQVKLDQDWIGYSSQRTHRAAEPAYFSAKYRPTSSVFYAKRGSLDDWLTARYCLYTYNQSQIYRGEIHHAPWPLQLAEADIVKNEMHPHFHSSLQTQPFLHYAHRLKALLWSLEKI